MAGAVVLPRPETLSVRAGSSPEPPAPPPIPAAEELQSFDLQTALASYERQFIEAALKKTGGNISEASRLVGLSRNGLKNKIRQYGL